jgi:hypothetical protein
MKKIHLLFVLAAILFLASCSAKLTSSMQKTYAPLDYEQEVRIFELNETAPANAEKLGTIKVGDSGFSTNCDYNFVLEKATLEARKSGGNAIKITEHKTPDIWSTCHRITADVLKVGNIEDYAVEPEAIDSALIDADYALVNVYRTGGQGALVNFDLHLGDSVICRVKSNSAQSVKVYQEGLNTLWAKTESKTEIPVNIEFGRVYYVECAIRMGIMVGRPSIRIVDTNVGKPIFTGIQEKKNKKKNKKADK